MRAMVILLFVASSFNTANSAEPTIGDRVFVKDGTVAKNGDAVVEFERIPFPATVEAIDGELLWLGRGWVRKSDVMSVDEALASYTKVIERNPKNVSALRSRAYVWLVKDRPNKAMDDCNQAIQLDSKQADSYVARASIWDDYSRYEKGFDDCTMAITLDPECARAYYVRGVALVALEKTDDSIKDLTEAIRLDPGDLDNYLMRGDVLAYEEKFDDAIKDYTEIIRRDPKSARAFDARAEILEAKGEYANALNDLAETHKLQPKSAVACNHLARLLAACPDDRYRDGKKAVEYGTMACELRGKEFWGDFGWLAAAYAEAGDFGSAIKFGQKALSIAPDYAKKDYTTRLEFYRANKPWRELRLQH